MTNLDIVTIGFPYIDEISDPPIRLTGTGVELRNQPSYYFDNSNRDIDSFAFQYTLEGAGVFEINNKKHILNSGKAFFTQIPSDTKYYFDNTYGSSWKFLFVLFMGRDVFKYYDKIISTKGNVFSLDENSPAIRSAIELFTNAKNGSLNNTILASGAAFDFLCKLCYCTTSENTYSYQTRQVITLFNRYFSDISGLSEVADKIGISQSHLSRSFFKDVGISPLEYLTKIRLNHALDLLINTNLTINEIATQCGYDNGNYFGKVFKKYMNTTPINYRLTRRL